MTKKNSLVHHLESTNRMHTSYKMKDYGIINSYHPFLETSDDIQSKRSLPAIGKTSFLVFHRNKYVTVPTTSIAFFYIKYEGTVIVTFDKKEYSINYSLEQVQELVPGKQFFRLNRQYLLNFDATKEVEHYFARKLLVIPTIAFADKLIVSKEKARLFLDWLENR